MASISTDPNGRRTIQFVAPDSKRRSIRLGKVSQRVAEEIRRRVEYLVASVRGKVTLDGETSAWLAGIGDDLHEKLAAVGLVPSRSQSRVQLGEWLETYIASRTDVKPNTRRNLTKASELLIEHFGPHRDLRNISEGEGDDWARWLKERYAVSSWSRYVKHARQFFRAACRKKMLTENPFAEVKAPCQANESRKSFVSREAAYRVLDACPDAEWRLIFALSRFGGLRCPSEHLSLQWADVDWERGRFRIVSPKKEHLEGGGIRWVPIFPELRPYLEEAFELAPEGTVYVINRYREANSNLRTQLMRILRRAGVSPWPRLFHNLRASRKTELAAEYPLHVVCYWIDNTEKIARKHYLQVTDDDFDRAAGKGTLQNPVQQGAASACTVPQEFKRHRVFQGFCEGMRSLAR